LGCAPRICAGEDATAELMKAKLAAAETAYRLHFDAFKMGTTGATTELCYLWSKRVLEAETQMKPQKQPRIDALKRHLARIEDMDKRAKRGLQSGSTNPAQGAAVDYFLLEANMWLTEAEKKTTKGK
jgi:hypothetical protein